MREIVGDLKKATDRLDKTSESLEKGIIFSVL